MANISPTGRVVQGPVMQQIPIRTPEVVAIKLALRTNSASETLRHADTMLRQQAELIRDMLEYIKDRAAYAPPAEYAKLRGFIKRAKELS